VDDEIREGWPIEEILLDLQSAYEEDAELRTFWSEESAGLRTALLALSDHLGKRYTYLRILGIGGSGVVLRLRDDVFPRQDVAVKFPRPVLLRAALLADMLNKEIDFLAELKYPGIVRILYHARLAVSHQSEPMPFYLMEAVDGNRSDKYISTLVGQISDRRSEAAIEKFESKVLEIFRAVLDSIRYLHEHTSGTRVHLDIKPENILITPAGKPVLIDLGTCKQVRNERDKTVVACTRPMAAPSLARRLSNDPTDKNRAKGEIERDEILPTWDLWTFAASILKWLGIDHSNGHAEHGAPGELLRPYTRKYLILLAARLMANETIEDMPSWFNDRIGLSKPMVRSMRVGSASEGLELLDRLIGTSNPIDSIPEMAVRAVTTLQPSEGVHVPLTNRLIRLLDQRALRRLDSIAQLGMVVEVYPEARHTRREHSLGTYGWAIQFLKALYADPVAPLFKQWITAEDCRDVLLAALLHDIGHFPLAHELEEVDDDLFNHADLTSAWLKGSYKKLSPSKAHMDTLDAALAEWGSSADRVLAVLGAKATSSSMSIEPKSKLLLSIISGPIDADKIDYLLRDSDRMRLPYPRGIDIDRVLRSLTTVVIDKVPGGARDVPAIAVHAKGKVAAEFVSIARYAMFSQGYWHHTVRAMKAMLARAVRGLVAEYSDSVRSSLQAKFLEFAFSLPESIFAADSDQKKLFDPGLSAPSPASLRGISDVPQLAVTDVAVLRWFEQQLIQSKRPEASLINGLLRRRLYKRLWVVSYDMQPTRWDGIVQAWSVLNREKKHRLSVELERRVAAKVIGSAKAITGFSAEGAREAIEERQAQRAPWLLVDIPESRPGAEVGLHYVLEGQRRQLRKDDKVAGSTQESEVWKQYAGSLLQTAGKIRIFCDPELVDVVEAAMGWEEGIETVMESLSALRKAS
jgi:HD superfamily phosphohydrolase